MRSIEDQIKEIAVDEFYNIVDKNMSIGCGDPFKLELIKLLQGYDIHIKNYFELIHKPVLNTKRSVLEDLKREAELLLSPENKMNMNFRKLCEKIKGFNV